MGCSGFLSFLMTQGLGFDSCSHEFFFHEILVFSFVRIRYFQKEKNIVP